MEAHGRAFRYRRTADENPWGSHGFEWMTRAIPIKHNFEHPPIITRGPYDYHLPEELPHVDTTAR